MAPSAESERQPRPPQVVAKRVLALLAVVEKAHNRDPIQLEQWVFAHRIDQYFSPAEAAFFREVAPSQRDIVNQSWRTEALVPLFWALGVLDELPPLNTQISWDYVKGLNSILDDPDTFIQTAHLRSREALDQAEEQLYNQHWRVRDAQLFRKPMPAELHPRIVYERRYGASWLIGWGDDWDNVPTDT